MSIHDGHRERLKKQFLEHGLEVFNDINVLELLLFFSIPRRDTNEIAHNLIDRFGSLDKVFMASFYELKDVPGVGVNSALLITFVRQLIKKIEVSKVSNIKTINSSDDAADYLIPRFKNETEEHLIMICLDSKRSIISCTEVSRGSVNSVSANARTIAQIAMKNNAVSVIISHNHPGGWPWSSKEDDYITTKIQSALNAVDIRLEDHIVICDDMYYSMANHGMLRMF